MASHGFWGCALLAASGTVLAALFPVHPFDLIYKHGIRHLTGTGPLPKRAAQTRFACGVGAVWLVATALAFQSGRLILGSVQGGALTGVALLVSTTDISIPSMIDNALFLRAKVR